MQPGEVFWPMCAREGCEAKVAAVVVMGETGIAYSCTDISHLKDFMYATRHLGSARMLQLLQDSPFDA